MPTVCLVWTGLPSDNLPLSLLVFCLWQSQWSCHCHMPSCSHCLQDLAVSSGSACTSASLEPSYVLRALGVEEDMAHTSLR